MIEIKESHAYIYTSVDGMVAAIGIVGLLVAAIGVVFLMTSLLPAFTH